MPAGEIESRLQALGKSRRIPHILLLIETCLAHGREIVEGITRYALVQGDYDAMARMAADHFFSAGLRRFAYFAYGEWHENRTQRDAFLSVLRGHGHTCHVYPAPVMEGISRHWNERQRPRVLRWLRSLPRGIGIFAGGDSHAIQLVNLCNEFDIAVPEDIAILGCGNDPVICETLRPTLSSVDLDCRRLGYEAARLLAQQMAGRYEDEIVVVPPSGIVVRQSTDHSVADDADVVQAMRFIRDFACTGIDVDLVAKEVGMSPTALNLRFRKHLGRTPKAEIMRIRIEHAKRLLAETDAKCANVAKNSGFNSMSYFSYAFHRETGMTPNAYRQTRRLAR